MGILKSVLLVVVAAAVMQAICRIYPDPQLGLLLVVSNVGLSGSWFYLAYYFQKRGYAQLVPTILAFAFAGLGMAASAGIATYY